MYTSFHIKNFRGFEELEIGPLDRVNLIAGKNNVGKTSLLEAIWIHQSQPDLHTVARVNNIRGLSGGDPSQLFMDLFHDYHPERHISLLSIGDEEWSSDELMISASKSQVSRLELSNPDNENRKNLYSSEVPVGNLGQYSLHFIYLKDNGAYFKYSLDARLRDGHLVSSINRRGIGGSRNFPVAEGIYLSPRQQSTPKRDAERLGTLEIAHKDAEIVDALREIDPRLVKLTVIATGSTPMIYGDIGLKTLVPITLMGDGMVRLLSIVLAIANAPESIVLIDEVENGLHHSVLTKVWKAISIFARRFDVQVFATTHSYECIQAAHEAFEESEQYDFRLHRLERIKGKIEAITYDQESLGASIEANFEVR